MKKIYPKEISLKSHNRHNEDAHLEQIEGADYKFVCDDEYLRCIFEENNVTLKAIDPSGGPFLNIGYEVSPGFVVKSISQSIKHHCFVVTLKQKEK